MVKETEKRKVPSFNVFVYMSDDTERADKAFLRAAWIGDVDAMYDAFSAGASMRYAKRDGTTPLIAAVQSGQFDAFRFAVTCGGDLNVASKDGNTPLHHALSPFYYDKRIIQYAIRNGADVNAMNNGGSPVLFYAMHTNPEVARLLVEAGADVDLLSKSDLVLPSRGSQRRLNNAQVRRWLSGSEMPSFLSALGFDLMDECPL